MKNKIILGELKGYEILVNDNGLNCIKDKEIRLISFNDISNIDIIDAKQIKQIKKEIRNDKDFAKKISEIGKGLVGYTIISTISPLLTTTAVAIIMVNRLISRSVTYRFNLIDGKEFYGAIFTRITNEGLNEMNNIMDKWKENRNIR